MVVNIWVAVFTMLLVFVFDQAGPCRPIAVTGCGITLTVSRPKPQYKMCHYFIGSTLNVQILYINILNYRYFHTLHVSTFLKIKKTFGK